MAELIDATPLLQYDIWPYFFRMMDTDPEESELDETISKPQNIRSRNDVKMMCMFVTIVRALLIGKKSRLVGIDRNFDIYFTCASPRARHRCSTDK